jgi:hypothetical protein
LSGGERKQNDGHVPENGREEAMGGVRHLPVWVAAIVFFVLGAVWYSLFAGAWLAGIGKTMEQLAAETGGSPLPYAVGFAAILLMCYTLAWLIARLAAESFVAGMRTGLTVGLGFIGALLALNYGFEWRTPVLWAINVGYAVLGLAIAGAVIGGWRRRG